ncbi:hybrid sensor histidine kinase/response regulator [Psychrobium sp. MM17-31]|uniref:ATP-binding response regulator n=1 Tax=Psychrobium sp. MM17-31 TaxID=2917758 RepID=UPI001EF7047C|nr:hybrid sensor histidine kinase/response regulator [Psychrobium sp. MM17-31]MCG7531058.1 hybrid sensor histidine kinase/response regulator [Psychrobium sp. MM17-31]
MNVKLRQLELIRSQMYMGSFGSIAAGLTAAYLFFDVIDDSQTVISWLTAVFICALANAIFARSTKKITEIKHADSALKYFAGLVFFTGVVWGMPSLLITDITLDSKEHIFFLIGVVILAIGMSSSALGSITAYLPMYYSAIAPLMIITVTSFVMVREDAFYFLGIAGFLVVYTAALFLFAFNINQQFIKSIRLEISNHKLAKDYDKQRRIAEANNRAKSKFLAAASHDLRQPLQAMMLFLDQLNIELTQQTHRQILSKVSKSAESLQALLDTLLDISRLEAGDIDHQKSPVSLQRVFENTIASFDEVAAQHDIRLRIVPTSLVIESNAVLLKRCLSNLITNAIKHSKGSKILVGAKRCGKSVSIFVMDNGRGIAAEFADDIYSEFYQVDNYGRQRDKGLGLGLSIVKKTCALLGHSISHQSEVNRYCLFKLSVKRCFGSQIAQQNTMPTAVDSMTITAWVVDDDTLILDALTSLLESWGATVYSAQSSEQVEQMMKKLTAPELIISDLRLEQGLYGDKLIDLVRENYRVTVPAIILTGDTAPDCITRANACDAILLHKPIKPAKLRMAFTKALS